MNRRETLQRIVTFAAGAVLPRTAHAQMKAEAKIHTRAIPASGERLPVIGLGTWQTFDVDSSASARAPLREVLEAFADQGGRVIDSSPMYGRSEEVVGDLKAGLPQASNLFIATKVWTTGKAAGIRQMEDSMRRLRVEAVDLMQVHNLLDVDTHLDTLDRWKAEGRVRFTGVTHYTASGAQEIARVIDRRKVDFVQINYSVAERAAEERLLPLAHERGIAVIANRPFAGGEMFARLRGKPLPRWAGDIDCTTWAQLLLKFVVSHPAMTCAIPASAKVEHTRDNMRGGYGRMPDERMRKAIVEAVGAA